MEVLELVQGSPEWHAHRFDHLNASEAPYVVGKSNKQSRDKLLYVKFTKEEATHSKFIEEVIFAGGHAAEAGARPIIEKQFDEQFSPLTCKTGEYSASYDGINFANIRAWEHKKINKENIIIVQGGEVPEENTWQLEHQFIACPSLEEIIFTVSDGTEENMASVIYKSDPKKRKKLRAAWNQFKKDLAVYVIPEVAPIVVANKAKTLPALTYEVKGTLINANLEAYRNRALEMVADSEKDLLDDQDFVDAKAMVKSFEDAEAKIKAVKAQVLAEFTSLDQFSETIDEIYELVRRSRINTSNKVDTEQKKRKQEIIDEGQKSVMAEIDMIEESFPEGIKLPAFLSDFGTATKNKRTIKSLKEGANQHLADCKIALNDVANNIRQNLKLYEEKAAEYTTLFPDLNQIIAQDNFDLLLDNRIMKHKEAEAAKAAAKKLEEEAETKRLEEAAAEEERLAAEAAAEEEPKATEFEEKVAPEPEIRFDIPQTEAPVQQQQTQQAPVQQKEQPGAMESFSDEKHDIDLLIHTANHFQGLVFPEMKTARGQQIAENAKAALHNIAGKVIKATETL